MRVRERVGMLLSLTLVSVINTNAAHLFITVVIVVVGLFSIFIFSMNYCKIE